MQSRSKLHRKGGMIMSAPLKDNKCIVAIPGSASGFFITACNSTPETAIAAPPSIEIKILGKRKS